eukprot:gb/GECG01013512.1/.p1 GENE.gb/GECG01013512.1/~~gb/GECG01013512.1/.p1  ORF type:complete len:499 (+),score=33.81 gb/GECG01013512.1/:1-1497(+)
MTLRFKKQGIALLMSRMEPQQIKALRNLLKPASASQDLRAPRVELPQYTEDHFPRKRSNSSREEVAKKTKEMGQADNIDTLSKDQEAVLSMVKAGRSVFFTGSAGSGKSRLLQKIRAVLNSSTVAYTAPTGIAACDIGGVTVHSFAGLTLQPGTIEQKAQTCASKSHVVSKWTRIKTLVIDEISMLDKETFEVLHRVGQLTRDNTAPFGGIQLVLCGDFFQLPPVAKLGQCTRYAFESPHWEEAIGECVHLQRVYRQTDRRFLDILNRIRVGNVQQEDLQMLNGRYRATLHNGYGILPTQLCTHKADVDHINQKHLGDLASESTSFSATDVCYVKGPVPNIDKQCRFRKYLDLKLEAQVILLKTIDQSRGLTNGARGVVVSFSGLSRHPVVQFINGVRTTIRKEKWDIVSGGKVVAMRDQIPLDLAWALSVHKSQGMTLDAVEIGLNNAFEHGQAYVALSRAKSLDSISLREKITSASIITDQKVKNFYSTLAYSKCA